MAKEFVFLFYPGDYLRDTQCLSEPAQVAYDRIMCEHMRNICITQEQLNFFTKRLNAEQKSELMMVLTRTPGGFFIEWVVDAIKKRRIYSESRRKNREGRRDKDPKVSQSYDSHMENEIEIVNEREKVNGNKIGGKGERLPDTDLVEYELWTRSVIDNTDHVWEPMYMNARLGLSVVQYAGLAEDHLSLLARYPKMRPATQQAFRYSLLKHMKENKDKNLKNGTKIKQKSIDHL